MLSLIEDGNRLFDPVHFLCFARAPNSNIDCALANANSRNIHLFPDLREDHELNLVDPGDINRSIPGYGADIASDINAQLLNNEQSIIEGEDSEILFSGVNVSTVHIFRCCNQLLPGKPRFSYHSNIMES